MSEGGWLGEPRKVCGMSDVSRWWYREGSLRKWRSTSRGVERLGGGGSWGSGRVMSWSVRSTGVAEDGEVMEGLCAGWGESGLERT